MGNSDNSVGILNITGGTVRARANSTAFIPLLTQVNIRNGGAIFDTAGFNLTVLTSLAHSVIAGDAATDGGVSYLGSGTLTLSGANTYTGPTIVSQGRLAMSLPSTSSSLVLGSGSTLNLTPNGSYWPIDAASMTNATLQFNYGSCDENNSTVIGFPGGFWCRRLPPTPGMDVSRCFYASQEGARAARATPWAWSLDNLQIFCLAPLCIPWKPQLSFPLNTLNILKQRRI